MFKKITNAIMRTIRDIRRKEVARFRYHRLLGMDRKKYTILDIAIAGDEMFDGFEFAEPERSKLINSEVGSRVKDVITLLQLAKTAVASYGQTGEMVYNTRLIADGDGYLSLMDWYWKPMVKAGLRTEKLLDEFRRVHRALREAERESPELSGYINRTYLPIANNYLSLLAGLSYLYLE